MSSDQIEVHGFLLAERVYQSEAHNLGTHSAKAEQSGVWRKLWNNVRPIVIENVLSVIAPQQFPVTLPAFGVFFSVSCPRSTYGFNWGVQLSREGDELGEILRIASVSVGGREPGRRVCVSFTQENPVAPGGMSILGAPFTIPQEGVYSAHLVIDGQRRACFEIEARQGDVD